MKKQLFIYLALSIFASVTYAQTGVGTKNPQGKLHVDGAKDNPATGTPSATQAANDVIVDKTTGFIGVGVLVPKVPLDMRSTDTQNAIGIGTTTMLASVAATGAVRYDESTGAAIDVSDGTNWKRLYLAPQKAVVVARKISTQSIASNASTPANVINWQEVTDLSGSFDPTTGVFTAPRTGTYTFLLTFNFVGVPVIDGSRVETQFYQTSAPAGILARSYKTFGKSMTGTTNDGGAGSTRNTQAGGSSIITLTLTAGATIVPRLYQNIYASAVNLRVTSNASDPANPDAGFNNLTIIEH